MTLGRPREWDREKLKWQLMHWAELPNSLNMNAFCVQPDVMISPGKLLKFVGEDEDFREVYDTVKSYIGARREEANSSKELSDAAYNKQLHVYDKFYKVANRKEKMYDHELAKDFKRFEKDLDKETEQQDALGIKESFDKVMAQLSALSKRNIEDSNISNETKS